MSIIFFSTIFAEEFIVENAKSKIVLLYRDTELKKELVSQLVKELNQMQISVQTDSLDKGTNYPVEKYDSVIILSNIEKFNPDAAASAYIKKNGYSKKIIYVATYIKFNNPYGPMGLSLDKSKIDVITTASPDEGKTFDSTAVEKVRREIIAKVKNNLSL